MDRAATKYDVLERILFDESVEPTDLPLSLLENITDGFSDDKQIGKGGFAKVYKGTLSNGTIAVKKMELNTHLHENKFKDEIECLMKAKHKNVVRFLGYCCDSQGKIERYNGKVVLAEVQQRLLCFEYLPKGSLQDLITDASRELDWTQCFQIIKGICVGLHYLHENCIVHLDLKPANILFDDNMVPKIADFGLSRCFDETQSSIITLNLSGTIGYIAPEVIYCGRITYKSDMYSLGVIINEILSGKRIYLEDYEVLKIWGNRLDKLHREKQLEQLRVCAEIGKECIDFHQESRPDAQAIVRRLDEVDIIVEEFGCIGRELFIKCLLRLSRSYYGIVASLNRNFLSLVRSGEIYHLRWLAGVSEHWIYFAFDVYEWKAYDLERRCWRRVPRFEPEGFQSIHTYRIQSLAVGTDLLVFGITKFLSPVMLIYSILTNSWIQTMNGHGYMHFGSTSAGQKAYLAGGSKYDHVYEVTGAVMVYDSVRQVWEHLPNMKRARTLCSAAFMDGKLYVIGGVGSNGEVVTCGEEYDFERGSWRVIDNMLPEGLNPRQTGKAYPPLVAVVNNEPYAADYSEKNVYKYDKQNNRWITLGKLPEAFHSNDSESIGFKACGDKLIAIASPGHSNRGYEIYSWVPSEHPPAWNRITCYTSRYNFRHKLIAVMSC